MIYSEAENIKGQVKKNLTPLIELLKQCRDFSPPWTMSAFRAPTQGY